MKKSEKDVLKKKRDSSVSWFTNNLPYIRALTGFTLDSIATDTGISKQTLSLIENTDNKKKMSYYQYLVIRNYIENAIMCRLKYSLKTEDDYADALSPITAYVVISVCMNDMEIFSNAERDAMCKYWDSFKEYVDSCKDTPTAKTFYNALNNEILNDLDALNDWSDNASEEEIFNKIYDSIIEPLGNFAKNSDLPNAGLKLLDEIGLKPEYKLILYSITICFFCLVLSRPFTVLDEVRYLLKFTASANKEWLKTLDLSEKIRNNFSEEALEKLGKSSGNKDLEENGFKILLNLLYKCIKFGPISLREHLDWQFSLSYEGVKLMSLKEWNTYNSFFDFLGSVLDSDDKERLINSLGLSEEELA